MYPLVNVNKRWKDLSFLMDKSTISMASSNSHVKLPESTIWKMAIVWWFYGISWGWMVILKWNLRIYGDFMGFNCDLMRLR